MTQAWAKTWRERARNAGRCAGAIIGRASVRTAFARSALALFAATAWSFALAAGPTQISGSISSNTTWALANSPYVLTGEVQITHGAYLTIQPGVIVRANANSGLTVVSGALSAQGTSDKKIVFTSVKDVEGAPVPAAPGDWSALKFTGGTLNASSTLSHVQIRYGRGLVIESASPTLSDVQIDHNDAAAISLDLKASPLGQRLSASDNALNGIAVPAGEIGTDVVWALKGIPYVVTGGKVFVGRSGFRLTPARLQLAVGVSGSLELSLPEAAPAGGLAVDVVSSVPSYASVASTVVIAEGQRTASVAIQALAAGTTTITASRVGYANTTAQVKVVAAPTLTLAPADAVVGVGKTLALTAELSDLAPAGGLELALTSSDPTRASVPATVMVPAGASRATFAATGVAPGQATLTAQASGHTNGSANLTVRPPSLNLPAQFLLAPNTSRSLPIVLSDSAPSGGLTIALSSENTAVATLPASVNVAAGASAVNVDVAGVAVGTTKINASATGYETGSSDVIVDAIAIALNPPGEISIPVNLTHTYTVSLSKAAPAGGVDIAVAVADPSKASVAPASVRVLQGQTVATQTIALTGVAIGSTQLTVSAPGLTAASRAVQVTPPARLEFSRTTATVGKGLVTGSDVAVNLRSGNASYAPPSPLTIALSSSDPSKLTVPATLTVAAGSSYGYAALSGVDIVTAVTIDASAPGYTAPATKLSAKVIVPTLVFEGLAGSRSVTSERDQFYVYWQVPAGMSDSQVAVATQNFVLSTEAANPDGIIPGYYSAATGDNAVGQITIAAGRSYSLYTTSGACCYYTYVGQPTAVGSYRVGATLAGVGSWQSAVQTVASPELRFSRSTATVGKGLVSNSSDVSVQLYANGQPAPTAAPLTISLSSADPSKAAVAATVTVEAGASSASVSITGVDLADAVAIDASAPGYTAPATKLSAKVIVPTLLFDSLAGNRSVTSERDQFYVYWQVPAGMSNTQNAAATQNFALSTEAASPAGIIPAYYSAATGDNAVGQITIAAGRSHSLYTSSGACCYYTYVGQPAAVGSYRVGATLAGVGSWQSAVQTVASPELRFSRSTATVGKGLVSSPSDISVQLYANGQLAPTAAPLTISLSSADPSKATVVATTTVEAGASSASFTITGVDLADAVTIDASAPGYTAPVAKLSAKVIVPSLVFESLAGSRSVNSERDQFYVYWQVPPGMTNLQAAATTQNFVLSTEAASPAGIIPGYYEAATGGSAIGQITIFAGRLYSFYSATGGCCLYTYVGQPTVAGSYRVGASLAGVGSWQSAVQTVASPELGFSTASSNNRATVGRGLRSYQSEVSVCQRINGQAFNGATDLSVRLACTATNVCTVPGSVVIRAGESCVNFPISGIGLGSTRVIPSATGYLSQQELDVAVVTPILRLNGLATSLSAGATDDFTVSIETPGATYSQSQPAIDPIPIAFTSATPSVATVAASSTIPRDQTASTNIRLTAVGAGTTTVTASAANVTPTTSPTITVGP